MPTYEYQCQACGHAFERFESITARPHRYCPRCEKPAAERKISAGAGLIFKGAGFYTTEYRSSSYQQGASVEKGKGASKAAKAAADKS